MRRPKGDTIMLILVLAVGAGIAATLYLRPEILANRPGSTYPFPDSSHDGAATTSLP